MGYFKSEMAFQLVKDTFIEAFGFIPQNDVIKMSIEKPYLNSDNRKPNPGMIIEIMSYWQVKPENTLYVGDRDTDKLAADNSNCDFMWAKDFFGF